MRAVVQRVTRAQVRVGDEIVGSIARGFCVLLGVAADDTERDAEFMAGKIAGLRILKSQDDRMNCDLRDAGGAVLLISQFTLLGDVRKGRRPSFITAAREDAALALYEDVGTRIERCGIPVSYGRFGAMMEVELVNDGPVTILIDSKRAF